MYKGLLAKGNGYGGELSSKIAPEAVTIARMRGDRGWLRVSWIILKRDRDNSGRAKRSDSTRGRTEETVGNKIK